MQHPVKELLILRKQMQIPQNTESDFLTLFRLTPGFTLLSFSSKSAYAERFNTTVKEFSGSRRNGPVFWPSLSVGKNGGGRDCHAAQNCPWVIIV